MKVVTPLLTAATIAAPAQAWAQEVFQDVEYIQGRTGFPDKIKGKLVLTATELKFVKNDSTLFTIPLETVKDVTNWLTTDPGGVGRKLLLGASLRSERGFCTSIPSRPSVPRRSSSKCHKKNSSLDMMAKIKFQAARVRPDTAKH